MNIIVFGDSEWGKALSADDERAIHILEVLRLKPGDEFRVGLLNTGLGRARLLSVDSHALGISFPVKESLEPDSPALEIHLILGHPRPPVMQRLLKDLNALGMASLSVCVTELSEKSYFQSRLWSKDLWSSFLVQGAQQGGHVHMMQVKRFWSLKKAIDDLSFSKKHQRVSLDIGSQGNSLLAWANEYEPNIDGPVVLAIGPERGWSDQERSLMADNQFKSFKLGNRILRTETACVLACGMLALAAQS